MKKIKNTIIRMIQNEWLQHLLFWAFAYSILLNMFVSSSEVQSIDHIYTGIFLFTLVCAAEINLLLLIPRFLSQKKYSVYVVLVLFTLLVFAFFNQLLFSNLIDFVLPGYYFISYYSLLDIIKFFLVIMASTTLLKLSKEWFYLNEARQKLIILQKEKADAELKALRNQLNPHFLFNSLNVIYSMTMNNSSKASETVLELSEILRYVLYEANKNFICVGSEILLIQNYLNLQKQRVNSTTEIKLGVHVIDEEKMIPPMLLLPLIENSFKHGVRQDFKNAFIRISLNADQEKLNFKIENNKPANVLKGNFESGGIGLKNIQSRLELLYPNCHTLEVLEEENLFKVILSIPIGEKKSIKIESQNAETA